MSWFHTHAHSEFSCLDGMADIDAMVAKAHDMGQPGVGLTDHGNMAGAFALYTACKRHDLRPFPGVEAYMVHDVMDKDAPRYHLTLMAYSTVGYQNLVRLCSTSHTRDGHFHRKPRMDWADFVAHDLDGIACLTGCFFGMAQQSMVSGGDPALIIQRLRDLFPHTFVEVQHHRTDHDEGPTDDELARELTSIAHALSLPVIVSQDCHYLDRHEQPLHDLMKGVSYGQNPAEASFPGDSYHMASSDWVQAHFLDGLEHVWAEGLLGSAHLLDLHTLTIPVLDQYRYVVPRDPDQTESLTRLCSAALVPRGCEGAEYLDRLDYELGVIGELGMDDYFLLVYDYVNWARSQGILVMARGSATGSLVCYLLGFTQADPLKWGLTFDRFLTPDRERPPDIDLDIEDTRRADVIEYLAGKYDLTQIGTFGRMGFDAESGRGSVFVKYMSGMRRRLGDEFPRKLGRVKDLHDLAKIDPDTAGKLQALGKRPLRSSPGAHAAGFVISTPELRVEDWVPTMLIASSDTTVTQLMMDDVEDAGYVKIDLLGLRSLSTMAHILELLGKPAGDLSWIPLDDPDTFKMLRRGQPGTGVFQLEGYTAARGCRELKPRTIDDLILVNALYRPATIDFGYTATYIERRKGEPYDRLHPIFDKHLDETLGVPVFQEQVLAILRDLGMPSSKLNDFLTAVKGKHAVGGYSDKSDALVAGARADFDQLCADQHMSQAEIEQAWSLVEGFAAYGFNKAHATAYSLLGYQLAFCKVHHPLEFHTALLATTSGDKQRDYVAEARRCGLRILRPDVNISTATWTLDGDKKAIRRGLSSIKGIGDKAAEAVAAARPYTDLEDLIDRTPSRPVTGGKDWVKKGELNGVLARLRDAGALRSIGVLPGEGQ